MIPLLPPAVYHAKGYREFARRQGVQHTVFEQFYRQMRAQGIFLAPSGYETGMVSFAHSSDDFSRTLDAARKVQFTK